MTEAKTSARMTRLERERMFEACRPMALSLNGRRRRRRPDYLVREDRANDALLCLWQACLTADDPVRGMARRGQSPKEFAFYRVRDGLRQLYRSRHARERFVDCGIRPRDGSWRGVDTRSTEGRTGTVHGNIAGGAGDRLDALRYDVGRDAAELLRLILSAPAEIAAQVDRARYTPRGCTCSSAVAALRAHLSRAMRWHPARVDAAFAELGEAVRGAA